MKFMVHTSENEFYKTARFPSEALALRWAKSILPVKEFSVSTCDVVMTLDDHDGYFKLF